MIYVIVSTKSKQAKLSSYTRCLTYYINAFKKPFSSRNSKLVNKLIFITFNILGISRITNYK